MTADFDDVSDLIIDLWDYCMELEDRYHTTADPTILLHFAVAIMTVQYYEDVLLNMEGFDVFQFYF